MRLAWLLALLVLNMLDPWPTEARADWLVFGRGGQVELPAQIQGPNVLVTTPDGSRSFPLRAFRSIVAAQRVEDDWHERRTRADRDCSVEARFAAAWWALEQGLTPEAIHSFRSALAAPGAAEHAALVRVGRLLDQLDAPVADAELGRLQSLIGGLGWAELRGRHMTLWHQGSTADATERLDVLDRVVMTFYVSLAAQGVELAVPRRRLVSVWFAQQTDYAEFLRRIGAAPFADTHGYYHPTHAAVFAFDSRTGADQIRPRQAIERQSRNSTLAKDDCVDLDRQSLLLDLRWRSVDLGIAAHETIHQLVAASGLAPRFDDFPNWLHEGFAAQFEVVRGGRWAGFGRVNDFRIADWRSIATTPAIPPLLRDNGLIHGYHRDRYAESWALVYFLRKTRPDEFVTFLNLLRTPRSPNQPNESGAAFVAAFGADLAAIGTEWRAFLNERATPLETHSRRATVVKSF